MMSFGTVEGAKKVSNLFAVESFGRVERLYESGRVSDKQRVADSTGQHTDHGQPDFGQALRRIATIANAQHV